MLASERGASPVQVSEGHRFLDLVGGVVAYNEERRLASAVESLLAQKLPPGARWRTIWIVVSGCTDRTPEVAEQLATRHPEVQVLYEPERRGKASALGEVFRAARGDFLVLLNADAAASPGAVEALLQTARGLTPPYAVMGHPEAKDLPASTTGAGLRLLWDLHHRLHEELLRAGEGTHLSDELLLLPISHLPPLPENVVNDGAYIGAWLRENGGALAYASEALVSIEIPGDLEDHLRQRRRIHVGHRQVRDLVGVVPTTMAPYLLHRPGPGLRLLRKAVRAHPRGRIALLWLGAAELISSAAAAWDRVPPRRSHRLWETIRERSDLPPPFDLTAVRTSRSRAPPDRAG